MVKQRRQARLILSVFCLFGLGCGRAAPTDSPSSEKAETLRIAAATDLQRVLPDLVEKYKGRDADVVLTFGASGQLAEQIRKGAPFDVFLSANMKFVEDLEREGVVAAGSVRPYARGALVVAVHQAASGDVDGIADLVKPKVRKIAIANPKFAPYGAAANQALERAGLGGSLGPKLVLAESVRQAFIYVEQGDAEAALVSRSLIADGGGLKVIEVDSGLYDPLIQGLGIVAQSDKLDRARRFVEFVVGEAGQSILGAHGFRAPGEKAEAPAAREGAPHGG